MLVSHAEALVLAGGEAALSSAVVQGLGMGVGVPHRAGQVWESGSLV